MRTNSRGLEVSSVPDAAAFGSKYSVPRYSFSVVLPQPFAAKSWADCSPLSCRAVARQGKGGPLPPLQVPSTMNHQPSTISPKCSFCETNPICCARNMLAIRDNGTFVASDWHQNKPKQTQFAPVAVRRPHPLPRTNPTKSDQIKPINFFGEEARLRRGRAV